MKHTLHLLRPGAKPATAVGDWIVELEPLELADRGNPPIAAGRITHDQLVDLVVRASRVIVW